MTRIEHYNGAGIVDPQGIRPEPILRFFKYDHLPEPLRMVSSIFADAAACVIASCPPCAERTVALRKPLEAKDAAVRAALPPETA